MFDIASSKLLILGLVALMVIGPKDLPALLRTIGKYLGVIKRHANDFRAQFEEAMRESELDQIKKQVESAGEQAQSTLREAELSIERQLADARAGTDPAAVLGDPFADPVKTATEPAPAVEVTPPATLPAPPPDAVAATADATVRASEKTGA